MPDTMLPALGYDQQKLSEVFCIESYERYEFKITVAENHKNKETDGINSIQSSLKSHN